MQLLQVVAASIRKQSAGTFVNQTVQHMMRVAACRLVLCSPIQRVASPPTRAVGCSEPATTAAGCLAGDRFQLVWVTSHAELLKEAEADGLAEKTFPGQVWWY